MKNPLALFTGAALATVAALAGLNMTNWPGASTNVEKTPEITAETQQPPAGETAKVPEKPVAEEASKTPEKPAETAAVQVPAPPKAEAEIKPELDTVRVESDGQTVVAGRGKPGAEVSLKLGDQVLGKGIANADGSWVVVPDNPLPKGAHELTVEQKAADSAPVLSDQAIAVAVPESASQQAMVALTKPGAATKVLQSGENQQQAQAASETTEPAAPEQPAAEKPAETVQQPPEADTAQKPPETAEPAGQAEQPAATMAEAKPAEATQPAETAQTAKTAESVPLRLDAVDYNDKGDIIFSGRARAGSAIRLYVDNGPVGDAIVDSQGNWSFSGSDIIKPGAHTLRADQIDKVGKVMARIELPFQREDADAVAALNTPPAAEPAETQPSLQTTEVQPAPQTTEVAKTEPQTTEAQPQATETQPSSQTTEVQPPQTTEVAKTEPEASGPAPDQPVAEDKKEEVTTAAAAAAEQAAKTTDPDQPRSGKVVIQPGNNLWKLSRIIYGRGKNYTVIYQANKEQIRSPHRIYPGQIFAIPNANPPESIDPKRKDPLTSAEGGAAQ